MTSRADFRGLQNQIHRKCLIEIEKSQFKSIFLECRKLFMSLGETNQGNTVERMQHILCTKIRKNDPKCD